MGNKCSLNRHGLGAKHLTDDVVQPSPLPPPLYCCIGVTSWFADAPLPRCTGGEQVCSPPSPHCCIGGPVCSCPPVLPAAMGDGVLGAAGAAEAGGEALCSPAAAECQRGGRRAGLPLRHPFSRRSPPKLRGSPQKRVTETSGGSHGSPQGKAGGGAGRGRRPLPLPAPRTFCFSSQGQRTMRSEETQALTRRRAARRQAPGALRTGRCSPPRPARGEGQPRARPARERRGQSSAARRHCPPLVGSPGKAARLAALLRRPATPLRVLGPTWSPRPAPKGGSPDLPAPSGGDSAREPVRSCGCFPGHLVPYV